jgi:hypothetical protein
MRATVALRQTLVSPFPCAIFNNTGVYRVMFGFGLNESAGDHIISSQS